MRTPRTFVCAAGHVHDIARRGYVNLLQPQDRRSAAAGDRREAVRARADLAAAGVGAALVDELARQALSRRAAPGVVVDLGCGAGHVLGTLAERAPITGIGIDLSTAAIDLAAQRFPTLTWVVANADRRLPLLDGRVDLVLSVYGRRHPAECARVLAPHGVLLVAVPATDDLVELRTALHGRADARDRATAAAAGHTAWFEVVDRSTVRETLDLDREAVRRLLRGTYRGARAMDAAAVERIGAMRVTCSADVLAFRRRKSGF